MKTCIFSLLLAVFALPALSQDLIVTQADEEIIAKVVEIKRNSVEYYLYDAQEGTPLLMKKEDIYMIIYEDGMRQFFSDPRNPQDILGTNLTTEQTMALYEQGVRDAEIFYDKNALLWLGLGSTIYFPILGIATGGLVIAVVALTQPSLNLHDIPDQDLANNQYYVEGYQKQVQKHRLKKAAGGVAIGLALQAFFIIIVASTF